MISDRLTYTKYEPEDFEHYAALMMHDDVMRYITGKGLTRLAARERFKRVLKDNASHPETGWFAVHLLDTQDLIGLAKLVDFGAGRAEVGYALLPEYWGKQYASEILQTMIALAQRVQAFTSLIAVVSPDNPASIRVLEKQGFTYHEAAEKNGDLVHHYVAPISA